MCRDVGLEVIWSRFVRAGAWHSPLDRNDDRAKEILVLCKRSHADSDGSRIDAPPDGSD